MSDTKQYFDEQEKPTKGLPDLKRNIQLDLKVWQALKQLKGNNETFNDVILRLMNKRTKELSSSSMGAIKYERKTQFINARLRFNAGNIGVEFEYNDVKGVQDNFTLDIKIRRVFVEKLTYNPSEFFGVMNKQFHHNPLYLNLYLKCVEFVLSKEFRVTSAMYSDPDFEDITHWRKIYYDYALSEDSFIEDIQTPLELSVKDKPSAKTVSEIKKSPSDKYGKL